MKSNSTTREVEVLYGRRAAAERYYGFVAVLGTALGVAVASGIALVEGGVQPLYVLLFLGFLLITGTGVSLGLHRFFSHRSFEATQPLVIALALAGAAAGQGYLFRWINDHQLHHRFTDRPGDPHSPYWYGDKALKLWPGLYHSHFGWLFRQRAPFSTRHLNSFDDNKAVVLVDRFSILIVLIGVVIPGLIAFAIEGTWIAFLKGTLWGGFVRMFVMNHVTWAVNSIGHVFGTQPVNMTNHAKNNLILGLLAFGDGWHANHHLYPKSARHGIGKWQPDSNWALLRLLQHVGWVSQVNLPPPNAALTRLQ